MIRGILLDNGGVLQAPSSGYWLVGPRYAELAGDKAELFNSGKIAEYCHAHAELLPEAQLLRDEDEELSCYFNFYRGAFAYAGIELDDGIILEMSRDITYNDNRVYLFDDVLRWLGAWRGRYRLGLLSDATPSSRRINRRFGLERYLDNETYSFELGVTKPSETMFRAALDKFGLPPEEILFTDDFGLNLDAAAGLGMCCVQMRRGEGVPSVPDWEGPFVRDLAELDRFITETNAREGKA